MGNRLTKIVTRTGDDGSTGLGDGTRVGKDAPRVAVLGDIDELNSAIGVVLAEPLPAHVKAALRSVQNDLFDLGGEMSIPGRSALWNAHLHEIDARLEALRAPLPPLREFVLPGGTRAAATCHLARTICRRAERSLVALGRVEGVSALSIQYLNRLSDFLFLAARTINAATGTAGDHLEAGARRRPGMTLDAAQSRLAALLARSALGDRNAFAELYRATSSKLFAVSLRIVRERQLAEEVLQDSFVNIWRRASDYAAAKSAPMTWMTAIVRNRSLDIVRRTREEPDIDDALAANLADERAAPPLEAAERADAHSIQQCLGELDAEQRQTIALAFFHGLTHSELADHLRRPLGTVKTHIRRGLIEAARLPHAHRQARLMRLSPAARPAKRLPAQYVLGTLRGRARSRFEAMMRLPIALWPRRSRRWEAVITPLADRIAPVDPPARVWRCDRGAHRRAARRAAPSYWRRVRASWFRAALPRCCSPSCCGRSSSLNAAIRISSPCSWRPIRRRAWWCRCTSSDMLKVRMVKPWKPKDGMGLELWAMPKDGKPRSLGMVKNDMGETIIRVTHADPRVKDAMALAVSMEPVAGSPTGEPTGAPVLCSGAIASMPHCVMELKQRQAPCSPRPRRRGGHRGSFFASGG